MIVLGLYFPGSYGPGQGPPASQYQAPPQQQQQQQNGDELTSLPSADYEPPAKKSTSDSNAPRVHPPKSTWAPS